MQVIQSVSLPRLKQHVLRVVIFTRVRVYNDKNPAAQLQFLQPHTAVSKYFINTQINKASKLLQPQVVLTTLAVLPWGTIKTSGHV